MIRIVGPKDYLPGKLPEGVVDTTSRSRTWSRGLSPFFLGPVPLYDGSVVPAATCVENGWQFSKVYPPFVGPGGLPLPAYFQWAKAGWENPVAQRYPMGKGAIPAYSWWAGETMDYIAARKRIYIPLYAKAVLPTAAFNQLLALYKANGEITLWDFDGYDHRRLGMTLREVVDNPDRKMGHAFVLALLLEKLRGR